MEILVFKTNLTDHDRVEEAAPSLDIHPLIFQWNVDLNDNDYILRVVGKNIPPAEVEQMVMNAGYWCEELQ
jgi:hypothetical protein